MKEEEKWNLSERAEFPSALWHGNSSPLGKAEADIRLPATRRGEVQSAGGNCTTNEYKSIWHNVKQTLVSWKWSMQWAILSQSVQD